jgi:predicted glycosyltransferase
MKILQYSQHIWGVGHFFRGLEISKALEGHEVVLITGGDRLEFPLPIHVRERRLPGIMTGENPKQLVAVQRGATLGKTRREREKKLLEIYLQEAPDVFLIEFYPFGRNAFRFELDPLLEKIRKEALPKSLVACSLRDILVEKTDPLYEERVIGKLNRFFDALLIHADPSVVRLDETFGRMGDIGVPVVYTGFVASRPAPGARSRIRKENGIGDDDFLIAASAGGGKAGAPLLKSVVKAFRRMQPEKRCHLHVFSGPYMDADEYGELAGLAGERTRVSRFTSDFPSYLAASDLSVSMAGYNTCMNILSAGVRSLVWPFSYDREQGIRAQRLARMGTLRILSDADLVPERLAHLLMENLLEGMPSPYRVDLEGAFRTAKWLMERVGD